MNLGIGLEISPIHIPPEKLQSPSNHVASSEPLLYKTLGAADIRARAWFWPPPIQGSVISYTMSLSQPPGPLWLLTLLETSYLPLIEGLSWYLGHLSAFLGSPLRLYLLGHSPPASYLGYNKISKCHSHISILGPIAQKQYNK